MQKQKKLNKNIPFVIFILLIVLVTFFTLQQKKKVTTTPQVDKPIIPGTLSTTNEEWKKILTPEQYTILREAGTEIPFTGALLHNTQKGVYVSVGCEKPLFRSEDKYDSGTGWPSFTAPISLDVVVLKEDYALGIKRVEVLDTCGGHLGHVFDDGPLPTGKRYCMNSVALRFITDEKK